tara:strand:- start:187 stop:354 length:168 start_codon:yes stop_codon:yes gene_type:complete
MNNLLAENTIKYQTPAKLKPDRRYFCIPKTGCASGKNRPFFIPKNAYFLLMGTPE